MKRFSPVFLIFCLFSIPGSVFAQDSTAFPLIPYPSSLHWGWGAFVISPETKILSADGFAEVGELNLLMKKALGVALGNKRADRIHHVMPIPGTIQVLYDSALIQPGSYKLKIAMNGMVISARDHGGVVHAVETIRQLLPVSVEEGKPGQTLILPVLDIEDAPAYAWRGMHLDVSRHFFSVAYLEKFIDRMALYKMNKLHLHLTDDEGWRIEIKKYPKLTEEGAWRRFDKNDSLCMKNAKDNPDFTIDKEHIIQRNGKTLYGGYYTQKEMKNLVAYAAGKDIDIIPEIDMPGHMMAAINSYPFLTCNGENSRGELFTKPICPCNESTFEFAKDIFSEIMQIFPSEYIHIGGDEVDRADWAKSDACKVMMKKNGIKDLPALQSYFINRMEKFFNSRGRKLIGWDEVIEGGISPTAIVMYWRTWVPKAPVEAVRNGNTVIMVPGEPLYFDSPADQYSVYKVYHFNPIPKSLNATEAKAIIGAQANIWTERIPSERRADYMSMPRMTALAENLWTNDTTRYNSYQDRLVGQYPRMEAMKINYRLPDLPDLLNEYVFTDEALLSIRAVSPSLTVRFTEDGSLPAITSPVLPATLPIKQTETVRVAEFTPTGTRGDVYDLHYTKEPMLGSVKIALPQPGLACNYYKAYFEETTLMQNRKPDSSFTGETITVPETVNAPSFGLSFDGYITIPADGIYSFFLTADDGALLKIGGRTVVDNDGNHSARERSGQIALAEGAHPFQLGFIEGGGGFTLSLKYSVNGSAPQEIPAAWLKH